jgi:L,D-transpeptidase ErfK/SrfK
LAASFPNETDAQKLTAMLNHQGPSIPARMLAKNGEYQVIAGPFKSKQETTNIAKRIKLSFATEVSTIPPKTNGKK